MIVLAGGSDVTHITIDGFDTLSVCGGDGDNYIVTKRASLKGPETVLDGGLGNDQYFPKGKSLEGITQAELNEVAVKLNRRPRKTLGFMRPAERLAELIDAAPESGAAR